MEDAKETMSLTSWLINVGAMVLRVVSFEALDKAAWYSGERRWIERTWSMNISVWIVME